jgi:hypothetical protein
MSRRPLEGNQAAEETLAAAIAETAVTVVIAEMDLAAAVATAAATVAAAAVVVVGRASWALPEWVSVVWVLAGEEAVVREEVEVGVVWATMAVARDMFPQNILATNAGPSQ